MPEVRPGQRDASVAIVGMAALFPGARDLREFWQNVVDGVDCITDVPPSRWRVEDYYDPDPTAPDRTYARRGGFIPDVEFDPLEFGLPPSALEATDTSQLLALLVAREALRDAGYADAPAELRARTGVILGVTSAQKLVTPMTTRLQFPIWEQVLARTGLSEPDTQRIVEAVQAASPPWQEGTFPGLLSNVVAGRIANRFDLGGTSCTVDAACASSLAALRLAIDELAAGRCDLMLTGGVDTDNSPFVYLCFSKTPALAPDGAVRPFDADSAGTLLGEGLGMLVLKRLTDAERDDDRIYAVIRGLGASSDGRHTSIYGPRSTGQLMAVQRAYAAAGLTSAEVDLVEAHGTGTLAGDRVELATLIDAFAPPSGEGQPAKRVALGSIKSQIGHTKGAAGAAGLIKVALALHHKVLPPTINVEQPNPRLGLDRSPLYLNVETRPWARPTDRPRRGSVSSFGFGGTNFHVVLEERGAEQSGPYRLHRLPCSVVLWAASPTELAERAGTAADRLRRAGAPALAALVAEADEIPLEAARAGVVAATVEEAAGRLETLAARLRARPDESVWQDPAGAYYRRQGLDLTGRVVALFPGQGAQYVNLGRELARDFPELRAAFGGVDRLLAGDGHPSVWETAYPPPSFDPTERAAQARRLQRARLAQPAIAAVSAGLYALLERAGFAPDFTAGHSFGELAALWAAGALSTTSYLELVRARAVAMAALDDADQEAGTLLAVSGELASIEACLRQLPDLALANLNSPRQTVVGGPRAALEAARPTLEAAGLVVTALPVAAAFHTPLVAAAAAVFAGAVERADWRTPGRPVYSNVTAAPYPDDPAAVRQLVVEHTTRPVRFGEQIEALYEAGGRCFVEIGPRATLTGLVRETLGDRGYLAVALNPSRQADSTRQLVQGLTELRVAGLPLGPLDPYDASLGEVAGPPSGAAVRLNGSNFVSERTRATYQAALDRLPQLGPTDRPTAEPPAAAESVPTELTRLAAHQAETARLHQQYLEHQAEHARLFAELARQQTELGAAETAARLPAAAWEALGQSLQLLRDHQAETSRVHEVYLRQQAEAFNGLVQAGGRSAHPPPEPERLPPPTPARPTEPPPPPTPAARSTNGTALKPPSQLALEPAPALAPRSVANGTANGAPTPELFTQALLEVVSERTGYPPEMLGLDLDLEADLGIDSIKRVEILAAMRARFPGQAPLDPEELAELRTLAQIAARATEPVPKTLQADAALSVAGLRFRPLPPPDWLEWAPAGRAALLTDDGTPATPTLAAALARRGWRVGLLRLAALDAARSRTTGEPVFELPEDEVGLTAALDAALEQLGPLGCFVHLHPPTGGPVDPAGLADARERRLIRQLYLLTGRLAAPLRRGSTDGRAAFMTVVRLDGELGLGDDPDTSSLAGGLFGLVRTLRLEWETVFCRAVDLGQGLEPDEEVARLLAELHDPDESLLAVGAGPAGRRTLGLEPPAPASVGP